MRSRRTHIGIALAVLLGASAILLGTRVEESPAPPGMVRIAGGDYTPLYGEPGDAGNEAVAPFFLSRFPVTNAEYLAFVTENPEWRRSGVPGIFADEGYLGHWTDDLDFGPDSLGDRPVVNVTWFAARAYAEWRGARLPNTAEWELVATRTWAGDPEQRARVLAWYARPGGGTPGAVGSTDCTPDGVCDLHGLVWEWVDDFNSALVTGESRNDRDLDLKQFCGSAAVNASNFDDYAAFLRFGFRSGLEARYTVRSLGFRLAADAG